MINLLLIIFSFLLYLFPIIELFDNPNDKDKLNNDDKDKDKSNNKDKLNNDDKDKLNNDDNDKDKLDIYNYKVSTYFKQMFEQPPIWLGYQDFNSNVENKKVFINSNVENKKVFINNFDNSLFKEKNIWNNNNG